jgi:hypothetical protein
VRPNSDTSVKDLNQSIPASLKNLSDSDNGINIPPDLFQGPQNPLKKNEIHASKKQVLGTKDTMKKSQSAKSGKLTGAVSAMFDEEQELSCMQRVK